MRVKCFMDDAGPSYHERLLHWIWENQHFDYQKLHTTGGQKVEVHSTGKHNESDGPDFKAAEISIGDLRWYGDVEIHWKLSDWEAHGHHRDPNFDKVVLHVVLEEAQRDVFRTDHSRIPTLCLTPYLSQSLHSFLEQYLMRPRLPCAGHLSMLSQEVFIQQLDKAHKEYFEQKINTLMTFYDPTLAPSLAWKKMLVITLFDGLGVSHNRIPMQKLAASLWQEIAACDSADVLRRQALRISNLYSEEPSTPPLGWKHMGWKHKGCRPGNHPVHRIKQGVACLWYIYHLPFEQWSHNAPPNLWKNLLLSITGKPSIGRERSSILYGTVFLPALFILGNLLFSETLKSNSWALWRAHRVMLPPSLLKFLSNTSLPPELYQDKLGTIYQLRTYCRPRHCQSCGVFKNIISS